MNATRLALLCPFALSIACAPELQTDSGVETQEGEAEADAFVPQPEHLPLSDRSTGTYCWGSGALPALSAQTSTTSYPTSSGGGGSWSAWTWNGAGELSLSAELRSTATRTTSMWSSAGIYPNGSSAACAWIGSGAATTGTSARWSGSCTVPLTTTASSIPLRIGDGAGRSARFEYQQGGVFKQVYRSYAMNLPMTCLSYTAEEGERPPFAI